MNASDRTVLFVLGALTAMLSVLMFAPAALEMGGEAETAGAFLLSGLVGLFAGGVMLLMARGGDPGLTPRGAILVTVGAWILLPVIAALPLRLALPEMSWTDALFETVSGLTTTGATVMTGLQDTSPAVLLWRAILQWIGGVGIIVTAMAIWPFLGIGGMQLFRLESSDASEKVLPRAGQIAGAVGGVYLVLTVLCFAAYSATGMGAFDAVAHAMTTVATGGFSTHDGSIGAFAAGGADIVALVFMVLAGLPFLLFVRVLQGHPEDLLGDPQVRGFLIAVVTACLALTVWLTFHPADDLETPAWRAAAVNAVSILTGTGYASADYGAWGGGAMAIFFFLMFVGGCAGSTTCSVKIFRYQIALSALHAFVRQYARPHAVHPVRYRGKALNDATLRSVTGFIYLFFFSFAVSAALLSALGLDPVTAVSGAATTLANVGPGLGPVIGPAGTFQPLPDAAKWVMIATMLVGRLEIFTLLVVFTPRFWRG